VSAWSSDERARIGRQRHVRQRAGQGPRRRDLTVGNGRDVLFAVITQLLPFIGYPRSLNALRVLNEVTSR